MPRGPRLDTPGALHHVVARGINGEDIFRDDLDRINLLNRLEDLLKHESATIYAWVFMINHIHLLIRTLRKSLATIMQRLLTGHAIYFNRRHLRKGHLFQNRYWSCLVEEERYFENLVAYIHLNPVQSGPRLSLSELETYPWCGHAAMLGEKFRPWHDIDATLARFGKTTDQARSRYLSHLIQFMQTRHREDFSGGGLIRSMGGKAEVLRNGRGRDRWAFDERILGSSEFVEKIIGEMEVQPIGPDIRRPFSQLLDERLRSISLCNGLTVEEMTSGCRRKPVVQARAELIIQASAWPGYQVTQLAKKLRISPKTIYRILNENPGARKEALAG